MSVVVDSSVVLHVLLGLGGRDVLEILVNGDAVAPQLLDIEVLHSLRKTALRSRATEADLRELVATYESFRIQRYRHDPFLQRIWQLRRNVTPYDASYVALAEHLNVPLITRDHRLANSRGHSATIQYID
jgi:predicted nucleic acid-binding protein